MPQTFVFRVDAGPAAGLGHLIRCGALGYELKSRGQQVVIVTCSPEPFSGRFRQRGIVVESSLYPAGSIEDSDHVKELLNRYEDAHLIVDGYEFGIDFLDAVAIGAKSLTVIDDYVRLPWYPVDYMVDHNPGAEQREYRVPEGAVLLLGPRFLLLSPEYSRTETQRTSHASDVIRRVLITMGGTDRHGLTKRAVRAVVAVMSEASVDVVIGPGSDSSGLDNITGKHVNVQIHRSPAGLSALIERADIAVSAGGMTLWELAAFGVPTVALVAADNQLPHTEYLARQGAVCFLGSHESVTGDMIAKAVSELAQDAGVRRRMSSLLLKISDGIGTKRVADALLSAAL